MDSKVHMDRPWDGERTKCGQIIWRGSPDFVRIFIPKENRRATRRGVTCKSCLAKRPKRRGK